MTSSRIILTACILAATAILVSLGMWQVRRLHWKEALIASVDQRIHARPQPLSEMVARWQASHDVNYWPVAATGTFDHSREQYYYTTWKGTVGWSVFTPLHLDDGNWLIVNRGFVPVSKRDPASRPQGQVSGKIEITGLARDPLFEKPNMFVPDNAPGKHEFYWKSFPAMTAAMGLEKAKVAPFFVDAGPAPVPGGYPEGGTTLISFPNNHFQYALTWFGLAAACLGVGGWFLFGREREAARRAASGTGSETGDGAGSGA